MTPASSAAAIGSRGPSLFDDLVRREAPVRPAPVERRICSDGGRLTLERRVASVWEGLLAAGVAECPMCLRGMEWSGGEGRCRECGSVLR